MRTIAILPLKSFDIAKQRLSGTLGNGGPVGQVGPDDPSHLVTEIADPILALFLAPDDIAGSLAIEGAQPLHHNAYKVPMMRNLVKRAIRGVRA